MPAQTPWSCWCWQTHQALQEVNVVCLHWFQGNMEMRKVFLFNLNNAFRKKTYKCFKIWYTNLEWMLCWAGLLPPQLLHPLLVSHGFMALGFSAYLNSYNYVSQHKHGVSKLHRYHVFCFVLLTDTLHVQLLTAFLPTVGFRWGNTLYSIVHPDNRYYLYAAPF